MVSYQSVSTDKQPYLSVPTDTQPYLSVPTDKQPYLSVPTDKQPYLSVPTDKQTIECFSLEFCSETPERGRANPGGGVPLRQEQHGPGPFNLIKLFFFVTDVAAKIG